MSPIHLLVLISTVHIARGQQSFCSYFGNKSPSPQPGLANCTWYRDSSCCVNEEITSLFTQVEVPDRANGRCRNYINYLMCYVCDPRQNVFYDQERLTVCADFCDDLLSACSDAVLKGDRLGTRYGTNGTAYCLDRRFQVSSQSESCFTLEASKRTLKAPGSRPVSSVLLVYLMACGVAILTRDNNSRLALVLLMMTLCLLSCLGHGHALVTDSEIKRVSNAVSASLDELTSKGVGRDHLQQLYDSTGSTLEELNATQVLVNIDSKLRSLTNDLDAAAAQLYTAVRNILITRNPSVSSNPASRLSNLSLSIYSDADKASDFDRLNAEYNSTYLRDVSFSQSVVKIPDSVDRAASDVFDTVEWSAQLDSTFKDLQKKHNIRWTYFGSETGAYRIHPASEWASNFAGFKVDYDPRSRPWYLAATSGPESIGIFLDCSASMGDANRWDIAVAAVTAIVNSLSREDQVNIICAKGSYYNTQALRRQAAPKVLGCNQTGFLQATDSNKAQLLEALNAQTPFGSGASHISALNTLLAMFPDVTASCQNIIVVVTDGLDTDRGHFENVCSSEDGNFGCNAIKLDIDGFLTPIRRKVRTSSIALKTVGIETGNKGSELPGKLACTNNGLYLQLLSASGIRSAMTPYFSYLSRLTASNSEKTRPTSPYVDASGLGRIITLSRVIYHPQDSSKLVGVVGVDAVIDDLENLLISDDFGLSYAFLINLEGRAVIHPHLRPSADLVGNPVYPDIRELEVYNGQPSQFAAVLSDMLQQKSGSSSGIVGPRSRQRGSLDDGVVWINGVNFTYYYSAIKSTEYAYAFVLTNSDTQHVVPPLQSYMSSQPENYYHEIGMYDAATQDAIGYDASNAQYGNVPIATSQSTFKLAARSLCDQTSYLLSDLPNISTVHAYFNGGNGSAGQAECRAGSQFHSSARSTVWTTQDIQTVWLNRTVRLQQELAWTYFGSSDGVFRIFPGTRSPRSYDPTRRPWYHRTLTNPPSIFATSAVHLDDGGVGKIVSFGQTIFQTKSASEAGPCTGSSRPGNCPCSSHTDCQSMYCYQLACSNTEVAGVAGVDVRYKQFAARIESTFAVSVGRICFTAGTSCLLITEEAEIVYDQSIAGISDFNRQRYENIALASLHGYVMFDLLDRDVFRRTSFINRQGKCQLAPYAPPASYRGQLLTPVEVDNYYRDRGPIPKFQNDYGCEKDHIQYHLNTESQFLKSTSLVRNIDGPCGRGSYRLNRVNGTNLLVLVVEVTTNRSNYFFNFNCHILNNAGRPGGYERKEEACDAPIDTSSTRTCAIPSTYSPPCSYSTSARLVQPHPVLAFLTLIVHILSLVMGRWTAISNSDCSYSLSSDG